MSDVAKLNDETSKLLKQLELLGIVNQGATKQMGLFEKQQLKVTTALRASPLAQMIKTAQGWMGATKNVIKITAMNTTMSKEQKDEHRKGMSVMQKFTASLISMGVAQKFSNKMLKLSNGLFSKLLISVFSLVSIFLIVGFALAALSVAFEGANSPILDLTEGLGPLHDAMQGLIFVISGEGDEGGLATAFDVLTAAMVFGTITALAFGTAMGALTASLLIVAGVFRGVQLATGDTELAMVVAIATAAALTGGLLVLKATAIATATGLKAATITATGVFLASFGLILAGAMGLYAWVTGAADGFKGLLLGVLSALAIFVGVAIVTTGLLPAAIIAGIVFFVAAIIKYWDVIVGILTTAYQWVLKGLALVGYTVVGMLATIASLVIGTIVGLITFVVAAITGFFMALYNIGMSFYNNVILGGGNLIGFFKSIPGAIADGFTDGFKKIFNSVIKIYNRFAKKMTFKIPDWVPYIGGDEWKLPRIPKLAKGGIVNSATLAMIGEDGPEAVVPLNRKNNPAGIGLGGGGATTININVGGVTDRTDKRALAREIGDLIRAEMDRGGRSHGNRRSGV
tara:strand:- start:1928 stop:3640 length:1713 start_codon:yes stop_codon:yes gene_type:complete